MRLTRSRKILFTVLTAVLIGLVLELGAFTLLSAAAGDLITWSDVHGLQASRQGLGSLDVADRPKRWTDHKIAVVPSIHPFLGYVHDSESPGWKARGEPNPEAAAFGFPQNRHSLFQAPAADRLVIAVLGGSVANQLSLTGHLERQLGRLRRFAGREPIVLSLAQGGYKQPQQVMTLNYFLSLGAHFDLVINLDGFNEVALPVATNVRFGYFPFFPRGWPLMVADLDHEQRRAIGKLTYLREERAATARAFSRFPWRFSMVAALLWKTLDGRLTHRIVTAEQAFETADSTSEIDLQGSGPSREYASADEMYRDLVAVWQRGAIQLHAVTAGMRIEYYHFLQPNQYVQDSKKLTPEELERAWDPEHPYRPVIAQGYPVLRAAGETLRQQGVPFHDLTMIFADVSDTLYRDACCHVNFRGDLLLAKAIANAVANGPQEPAFQRGRNLPSNMTIK